MTLMLIIRILTCPFRNIQLETGMPEVIICLFQLIVHVLLDRAMHKENIIFWHLGFSLAASPSYRFGLV